LVLDNFCATRVDTDWALLPPPPLTPLALLLLLLLLVDVVVSLASIVLIIIIKTIYDGVYGISLGAWQMALAMPNALVARM